VLLAIYSTTNKSTLSLLLFRKNFHDRYPYLCPTKKLLTFWTKDGRFGVEVGGHRIVHPWSRIGLGDDRPERLKF